MKKMCILSNKEFEILRLYCIDFEDFEEIQRGYDECDEISAPLIVEKMQQYEAQNHLFKLLDVENNNDIIGHTHRDENGEIKYEYILILSKEDMFLLAEIARVYVKDGLHLPWVRLTDEEEKSLYSLRDKLNDATF